MLGLVFSRPGGSHGLLYKQPCDSLIHSFSEPFPPKALRRRHAQTVRDSTSSYKIDFVIVVKNFLNPEGHANLISGLKVTAILLKGWIVPIGGPSSGRVCACSLRSSLFAVQSTFHGNLSVFCTRYTFLDKDLCTCSGNSSQEGSFNRINPLARGCHQL